MSTFNKPTRTAPPAKPAAPVQTHSRPSGKPTATREPQQIHREPYSRIAPSHQGKKT